MTEAQPYSSDAIEIPSAVLGLSRRITVWVPDGARSPSRGPVLYLNDGQNLFDSARAYTGVTWRVAETAAWLIERRLIPPLVIVGIDHGELRRAREYLPVEDDRNPFARDPLAPEYASFVTTELMPFIEREYPVARGASNTAFGGSSVWRGRGAVHVDDEPGSLRAAAARKPFALRRPRDAAAAGAQGAALAAARLSGCGNRRDAAGRLESGNGRRTCGGSSASCGRQAWAPRRLRVTVEEGASHSEGAWAGRFAQALEFLFGSYARLLEPAPAVDAEIHEVVGRHVLEAGRVDVADELRRDAVDAHPHEILDRHVAVAEAFSSLTYSALTPWMRMRTTSLSARSL